LLWFVIHRIVALLQHVAMHRLYAFIEARLIITLQFITPAQERPATF
jgi:hypothetical protein